MAGNRQLKRQAQIEVGGRIGVCRRHQSYHAQSLMVGADQNMLTIIQLQALMIDSARSSTELSGGLVYGDGDMVFGQFCRCCKSRISASYNPYMTLHINL